MSEPRFVPAASLDELWEGDLLDVEVEARFVQTLSEPDPETVTETGFGFA